MGREVAFRQDRDTQRSSLVPRSKGKGYFSKGGGHRNSKEMGLKKTGFNREDVIDNLGGDLFVTICLS